MSEYFDPDNIREMTDDDVCGPGTAPDIEPIPEDMPIGPGGIDPDYIEPRTDDDVCGHD